LTILNQENKSSWSEKIDLAQKQFDLGIDIWISPAEIGKLAEKLDVNRLNHLLKGFIRQPNMADREDFHC